MCVSIMYQLTNSTQQHSGFVASQAYFLGDG